LFYYQSSDDAYYEGLYASSSTLTTTDEWITWVNEN
jgi:hypothetical protein